VLAAAEANGPGWLGGTVWTIVGLAAIPSCALWTWMSTRMSRPTLITGALLLQAVGVAFPALSGSVPAAVVSASLFGATFVGITTLSLATGWHLGVRAAVVIVTAGHGIGQVIGPLIVTPLLNSGYGSALLVAAGVLLTAAIGSALLRTGFPHYDRSHHAVRKLQARTERNTNRADLASAS
jgi:MFS family permease